MQQNKMADRKDDNARSGTGSQRLREDGTEGSDLNKSKMGPDYKETDRPGWKEDLARDKQLDQQSEDVQRRGKASEVSGKDLEYDGRKAEIDVGKERTYKEGADPDWKDVAGREKQLGEQRESDKGLRYAGRAGDKDMGDRPGWQDDAARDKQFGETRGKAHPGKKSSTDEPQSNLPAEGQTSGEGSPQGR